MKNFSEFGESQEQEIATGQPRAKETDVAWLAGVFDGEGSLSIAHGGHGGQSLHPRMQISNCSMSLMLKAQRIIATPPRIPGTMTRRTIATSLNGSS